VPGGSAAGCTATAAPRPCRGRARRPARSRRRGSGGSTTLAIGLANVVTVLTPDPHRARGGVASAARASSRRCAAPRAAHVHLTTRIVEIVTRGLVVAP